MKSKAFDIPILFLIFNRPDTTAKVFERIRRMKPRMLYVAADGPRTNKPGESQLCEATRAIVKGVDWDCKVYTRYSKTNQGCRVAVSTAIDWFFSRVDEGIILEDDCVPNDAFFQFCRSLLEFYRSDERIMHICGVSFQDGAQRGNASYYFSSMNHVWGWATWKRAWEKYDVNVSAFPQLVESGVFASIFPDPEMRTFWIKRFNLVYARQRDTWDYQWQFAMSVNHGLSIVPNNNLVSNIGFGTDATHTTDSFHELGNRPTIDMKNLIHPQFVVPNHDADWYTFRNYMSPSRYQKTLLVARRLFHALKLLK